MTDKGEQQPSLAGGVSFKDSLRLATLQATGFAVEKDLIESTRHDVDKIKGIVAGLAVAEQLVKDCQDKQVMGDVDSETLEGDAAKVVMSYMERLKKTIRETTDANRLEMIKAEARIEGYAKVVDLIEKKHTEVAQAAAAKLARDANGDEDDYEPPGRRAAARAAEEQPAIPEVSLPADEPEGPVAVPEPEDPDMPGDKAPTTPPPPKPVKHLPSGRKTKAPKPRVVASGKPKP